MDNFTSIAASIAHVNASVASWVKLSLIHVIAWSSCKIHDEIVSNDIAVRRLGLVDHARGYDISFICAVR